jgi:predicted nucleic acid-binding protein
MIVPVFVDTNILIYSRDQREPEKAIACREWLRALHPNGLILSPQVLNETFSVALRKFKDVGAPATGAWIRQLQRYCTAPLNSETIGLALDLHGEHNLSWWDCPIVASAIMAGCRYLLSEDMQHQQFIRTVRVINPFRVTPSQILDQD